MKKSVSHQSPQSDRVAICMATFNPDPGLFRVQVESIRSQAGVEWHCFVSDDCSDSESLELIEQVLAGDERFTLSASPARLGFYRNFERALGMVPDDFELIALCDQDDRWHADKLASLVAGLGSAQLVYSDQRLVTSGGEVLSETYWSARQNNHTNFLSLLIANTVTGAASLFRRRILDQALPFPEVPGEQYHDHWLALVAMATGELAYVDRPLYDYVQHEGAVLGHDAANAGLMSGGWRRLDPRRWREILGGWGSAYFDVYLRLKGLAQIVLERCGEQMAPARRRALERFVRSDRSLSGLIWLALRPLRRLTGNNETLGIERVLVRGIMYRHLAALKRRLPDSLLRRAEADQGLRPEKQVTPQMRQKVAPLFPVVSATQPRRLNLLIPTIDLEHLFGGYIAKFSLARRLAESGVRTRIVTVDPTPPLPADWRRQVESYRQLDGLFEGVEIAFGRDGKEPLKLNPDDRFIATTWWTAHIATRLAAQSGCRRFLYMIQEYEPLTVPEGAWAELASQSYEFPHQALFSTAILRDYFEQEGIGVFSAGPDQGEAHSLTFDNAITPVSPPSATELEARTKPRLLFYARPQAHAARNLYEVGVEALRIAIERGVFGEQWGFEGIGSTGPEGEVDLGHGHRLVLRPRTDQESYGRFLAGYDIGVALMDAPHPSLVPIEMASAGMAVVTTTYGQSKTSAKLERISPNLIPVNPDAEAVAEGLSRAVERLGEVEGRVTGAQVSWPADWDASLDDALIGRITRMIGW